MKFVEKHQGLSTDWHCSYDGMTARINIEDDIDLKILNPDESNYVIEIFNCGEKQITGHYGLGF